MPELNRSSLPIPHRVLLNDTPWRVGSHATKALRLLALQYGRAWKDAPDATSGNERVGIRPTIV
jgi:hypothetical protein